MRTRRAQLAKDSTAGTTISPEYLSRVIGETVGKDAVIINEYPLRPDRCAREKAGTFFALGPAGGLGWGFGAALGAKLAAPENFVVATLGDGSYMFANPMVGHWVSAVHNLPILTIVFNNSRYGAVRRATLSMFKDGVAGENDGRTLADLAPSPPCEKMARAQGAHAERVEKPADLPEALSRARNVVINEKRQAMLNVITPYATDSVSRKFEVTENEYMRIDAYTHFIPEKYFNKIVESGHADIGKRVREIPCIHDLDIRRKIVDSFKDYAQIISYPMPPLEVMTKGDGKLTEEYTQLVNDGFAEICAKY